MGLTSLPTKTSGSLGINKTDGGSQAYSTSSLFASEWNTSSDSLAAVAEEIGLTSGATSGSLVAKIKEYINLDYYGTASMVLSNTLPNPAYNNGWTNPKLTQIITTNSFSEFATIITADAGGVSQFNSAVWWFDQTVPFGSYKISFNISGNPNDPTTVPGTGSDVVMLGLVYSATTSSVAAGLLSVSGMYAGSWDTWHIAAGSSPGSPYLTTTALGAYFSRFEIDFFGYRQQNQFPNFIVEIFQVGVLTGAISKEMFSSGQMGLSSSVWSTADLNRVGIILFGSCSIPFTMSISDLRVYPKHGDHGYIR